MLRGTLLVFRVLLRLLGMDVVLLLRSLRDRVAAREWSYQAVRSVAQGLLHDARIIAGIRTDADPAIARLGGGRIILANHQSILDIVVLSAVLPGRVVFVAKDELGRHFPFVSRVLRLQGQALIRRHQPGPEDARKIARLAERVDSRYFLVIFPEGTRSRNGELLPFQAGALRFALAGQHLPITAIAVDGGNSLRRLDDALGKRTVPVYHAGRVADYAAPARRSEVRDILDDSRAAIAARLTRWRE